MSQELAELKELRRRVERAECRANRALLGSCLFGTTAMILAAAAPGLTQSAGSSVRAPFRVVDNRGRQLMRVDTVPGGPRVLVFDEHGRNAVMLSSTENGGAASVWNPAKQVTVSIGNNNAGGLIGVSSRMGRTVGALALVGDQVGFQLNDPKTGNTVLKLYDDDHGGAIGVYSRVGKVVAGLTSAEFGGALMLATPSGKPAVGTFAYGGHGMMELYDENGNTLFRQP